MTKRIKARPATHVVEPAPVVCDHWTLVAPPAGECASCGTQLTGGSTPIWSTDKGLHCRACAPKEED
jgi:hypothetical protein